MTSRIDLEREGRPIFCSDRRTKIGPSFPGKLFAAVRENDPKLEISAGTFET
jgi:hypothetical protein